jgi:putative methionine-R-sulfoxide reductase with GAF domain
MNRQHEELLREFQEFALNAPTVKSVMERMSQRLHEKMTRYNWVGFYLVDPADPGILLVGPFVGSFTPNARIPLDTGLCGAAATRREGRSSAGCLQRCALSLRVVDGEMRNRGPYLREEKARG